MSTLNDVQDAIVDVVEPIIYPDTTSSPSILGNYVKDIVIEDGGEDYTYANLSFTGGGGTGGTATAVITDGVITSIVMDQPIYSFGYTSVPDVVIDGDGTGAVLTAEIFPVSVNIAAGDFLKRNLDDGLALGQAFISVFAINGMTRNTTRFKRFQIAPIIDDATLTLTVSGDTLTVGGTITIGQACMAIVNGVGYSYAAIEESTLDSIAAGLAALIPTATVVGSVITVPGVFNLIGRISVGGTARTILHSQEALCRVRVIANSNEKRDLLGATLEVGIADFGYYLPMPDLVSASIRPKGIMEVNMNELANAVVRDYLFLIEYHTVGVRRYQTIADIKVVQSVQIPPIT